MEYKVVKNVFYNSSISGLLRHTSPYCPGLITPFGGIDITGVTDVLRATDKVTSTDILCFILYAFSDSVTKHGIFPKGK